MKTIMVVFLAVLLCFGTTSASYAVKAMDGMADQDSALVVKNVQGTNIGTIQGGLEDVRGNVAFVIVTLNEARNGKKDVVLPVSAFSQGSEEGSYILNLNEEVLSSAPEFNYLNLQDPAYSEGIYRFYGQTPPWDE